MKRAQSGVSTGILIILITVALVLYILFLPPDVRDDLLNDGGSYSDDDDTPGNKILLSTVPGRVDYVSLKDRTHQIPSFRIQVLDEPSIITSSNSMNIVNSAFTKKAKKLSFNIDPEEAEDIKLSFNIDDSDGNLIIELNGDEIYNREAEGNVIIPLNTNEYNNELLFFVDSPGWAFFTKNEYDLSNIRVTANVKDLTRSEASHSFSISEDEYNNIERAELKLLPYCNSRQTGVLTIYLNGETIQRAVPDCGVLIKQDINLEALYEGSNRISFSSSAGSYIIDNIELRTYSSERGNPSYFFDIDKDYFDSDGNLKDNYDVFVQFVFTDDDSTKEAVVDVNQYSFSFRTRDNEYDRKIDDYIEQGTNRIEIVPEKRMDIARLRVVVES